MKRPNSYWLQHCIYRDRDMDRDVLREKIDELIRTRAYDQIEDMLMQYKDVFQRDSDLGTVYYLMQIYKMEKEAGQRTLLENVDSISALLERYTILKFYLRRIEFGFIEEELQDFHQYIMQNRVSTYELLTIVSYSVYHRQEVLDKIQTIIGEMML